MRVTLAGRELSGFPPWGLAASVRLLVPSPPGADLVLPTWNGNEFRLPDGGRPAIRTYTPLRFDESYPELDIDVVLHPEGAVAAWLEQRGAGAEAAVAGPGRGYELPESDLIVLAGDETAIPAIGQLLDAVPEAVEVRVLIELLRPDARTELPAHPRSTVSWLDVAPGGGPGDALVPAVVDLDVPEGARFWVAGEAAAVQRIRRHLFEQRGLSRGHATVRGYWKRGLAGE